jgi:hypothetical protein
VRNARRLLRDRHSTPPTALDPAISTDEFEFNLEVCNADGLMGWVVHPAGVDCVQVLLQDRPIGQVRCGEARADVAAAKPERAESLHSGFAATFPDGTFASACPEQLFVEFTARDGSRLRVPCELWPVRVSGGEIVRRGTSLAPLPADVTTTLAQLRPDRYDTTGPWSSETVNNALDDIVRILHDRISVKPVLRYSHYLLSMSQSFGYIGSHFDRINTLVDSSAKDFGAVASSPQEMLCIANHLYVLRSRGIRDGLAECGCFKGFSTCCLSQACAWLEIPMYVFDSFEGLPPSPGGYYEAGDFRGTIDEVTDNLNTFGQPAVVELHRGFFAETLTHFIEPFSCIWMDVDLESSSRDVMTLLPRLPPESCVFSHELPHHAFLDSRPLPEASEVLPPILQAFSELGTVPVGKHLTGYLGAIWPDGRAAPVLGHDEIRRIVEAAQA